MKLQTIVKELADGEGFSATPYRCTAGALTVGYGHNLDAKGLTVRQREYLDIQDNYFFDLDLVVDREQAEYILVDDIWDSFHELKKIFHDFQLLPEDIQHILINLHFQLGNSRFLGFKRMIQAIKKRDWKEAAAELRNSKLWREDTPARAERLAKRFESEVKK